MIRPANTDDTDFSVVVKKRASFPKPWRWEIYRAGRASPIQCSKVHFDSVSLAHREGKVALGLLLKEPVAKFGF
jgi:hypothetical protein